MKTKKTKKLKEGGGTTMKKVVMIGGLIVVILAVQMYGFVWPTSGRIASVVGWRICPFHGREFHAGTDIAAPTGQGIGAARAGRIIVAGWVGGYGNAVYIDHGNGWTTRYAHMSRIYTRRGARVDRNKTIGAVGSTGNSTGPHLHFEVRKYGVAKKPAGSYVGKYVTRGSRFSI